MERVETIRVLSVLKAAYPQFYNNTTKADAETAVNLWTTMFAGDSYDLVCAAVKAFIATDTKGFPPAIGQIKGKLVELTAPEIMSEMEAWNLVSKAISNSGYESKEEFAKLPHTLKRIVGSPNVLREWAMMDVSQVQTVVQSNFMRSYRAVSIKEQEFLTMPPDVQKLLSGVASQFKSLPEV